MTELRTKMDVISVDKACTCGTGRMRATGPAMMSHPPSYVHSCNVCGREEAYPVVYPTTEMVPAELSS